MFTEIKNIMQHEGEGFRRWFTSDDMDLYVWYDDSRVITSFQISLSDPGGEYLVTWSEKRSLEFARVSVDSSGPLSYKKSNLVVPGNRFNLKKIIKNFMLRSKQINDELAVFIANILAREEAPSNRHI